MVEQTTHLDIGTDTILDLDADGQGGFIAFTKRKNVLTEVCTVAIETDLRFPRIRKINDDAFIIADCRTDESLNGHVYNFDGQRLKSFFLGDGIADILVHHGKIVVTYFDEGVLGDDGPNNNGVAVFDLDGKQLFGFNSSAIWGHMLDCYCICKQGTNRVLFYVYTGGYPELKMYELNLDSWAVQIYQTPTAFSGAGAISSKGNQIVLHGSYDDKASFFLWDRVQNSVDVVGNRTFPVRGIKNGCFLAFNDSSYTILNPME